MRNAVVSGMQEGKTMQRSRKIRGSISLSRGTEDATMRGWIRFILNDAGGSLVEVAISSTVLFAMIFGVFEFAWASYSYHYVSDASREGARYAIVRGSTSCTNTPNLANCNASPDTIGNYVKGLGYAGINRANMTVTTTYLTATTSTATGSTATTWAVCSSGTCNQPGYMVNVAVTYAFPLSIPFVPKRTINVSSTSQMVIQQ